MLSTTTLGLVVADLAALAFALVAAIALRHDTFSPGAIADHLSPHTASTPVAALAYVATFVAFRLYRYAWRFASFDMLRSVLAANTVGVLVLVLIQYALDGETLRPSTLFIFWLMSIACSGGLRLLLRLLNIRRSPSSSATPTSGNGSRKRVVIMGAGVLGASLLRALQEDPASPYEVIGLLDDAPEKQGVYVHGLRVLGPLAHLLDLLDSRAIDEVCIAIAQLAGPQVREYVLACRERQVPVKVLPSFQQILMGNIHRQLEDFRVEDLLRRPPISTNLDAIGRYLRGKRILVTGGGGSIGSELCRQISAMRPAQLVLMGHGENSLHRIHQELMVTYPEQRGIYRLAVGSIADAHRVEQIFQAHRPEVVFHAAAHKHVPIMEDNVAEAVRNNVLGTYQIADACGRHGVERMVVISTDKAVYPSSVMGASKWLCEEVVRGLAKTHTDTIYLTVRFGNVLDSRGSVLPAFREQIKRGGPVTVTHPEVTRYFMTIAEAVQLVLQAGAIGGSGDLFLLNMGQPVRILDLARDMIRLSGFEPDRDIIIEICGLRPGEKLHERLYSADEQVRPAPCEGLVQLVRPEYFDADGLRSALDRLRESAMRGCDAEVIAIMEEVIPSFAEQRRRAAELSSAGGG
jgi:FlaA1/EpsC-like NDP-sugar epimerase